MQKVFNENGDNESFFIRMDNTKTSFDVKTLLRKTISKQDNHLLGLQIYFYKILYNTPFLSAFLPLHLLQKRLLRSIYSSPEGL